MVKSSRSRSARGRCSAAGRRGSRDRRGGAAPQSFRTRVRTLNDVRFRSNFKFKRFSTSPFRKSGHLRNLFFLNRPNRDGSGLFQMMDPDPKYGSVPKFGSGPKLWVPENFRYWGSSRTGPFCSRKLHDAPTEYGVNSIL